jgi:hypothetical protein
MSDVVIGRERPPIPPGCIRRAPAADRTSTGQACAARSELFRLFERLSDLSEDGGCNGRRGKQGTIESRPIGDALKIGTIEPL